MPKEERSQKRVYNPKPGVSSSVLIQRIVRLSQLGAPPGIIVACIDGIAKRRWIKEVIEEGRATYGKEIRMNRGMKYPNSIKWVTRNEKHRADAGYLAVLFVGNRERSRVQQGRNEGPIARAVRKADLYIKTYEAYLARDKATPEIAMVSFARFWGVVSNLNGGTLVMKKCSNKGCTAHFLAESGEGPRELCSSCRIEHRMFCGRCNISLEDMKRGRFHESVPTCPKCGAEAELCKMGGREPKIS